MQTFWDKCKGPFKCKCNNKEVELKAQVFRSAEDRKETKDLRTLAYILRKHMRFEGRDRHVLDMDFRHQTVLVNNKRVAEFADAGGRTIRGRIDRTRHSFKVNASDITAQCAALGYQVDGVKVEEEFIKLMGQ